MILILAFSNSTFLDLQNKTCYVKKENNLTKKIKISKYIECAHFKPVFNEIYP